MINIISLGAGVQSSTMALMAAHGEIIPMPSHAIFADTGDEPQSVYRWLDWLTPRLPFPVHIVSNRLYGKLSERELLTFRSKKSGKVYRKSGIPCFTSGGSVGLLPRKCTADFKITPIERQIRLLVKPKRTERNIIVTQWIGISRDEAHRMKPSRLRWCQHRWPLIDLGMSRQDCIRWMADHGYPKPPRSACVFCPYHSDNEWIRLMKEEPDDFQAAVRFESDLQAANSRDEVAKGIPFLHRNCVPLGQVSFESGQGELQFGNECEGMCGV